MGSLFRDLAYALRSLRRTPAQTLLVIVTLAVGIGGNTAAFSIVRTVLIEPATVSGARTPRGYLEGLRQARAYGGTTLDLMIWPITRRPTASARLPASTLRSQPSWKSEARSKKSPSSTTTWNLLSVLGIRPALGQDFPPDGAGALSFDVESEQTVSPIVLISHRFWRDQLGSDAEVIGRKLATMGLPVDVIGVLPADFSVRLSSTAGDFGDVDIWYTTEFDPTFRNSYGLRAVARLNQGVSLEEAQSELDAITLTQYEAYPPYEGAGATTRIVPLLDEMTGEYSALLWAFFIAVGLLLLIVCVNVASLMVLRAYASAREASIRAALGARRIDLVRQFLAESLVMSALGTGGRRPARVHRGARHRALRAGERPAAGRSDDRSRGARVLCRPGRSRCVGDWAPSRSARKLAATGGRGAGARS